MEKEALEFLLQYEPFCVPLLERLEEGKVPVYIICEGEEIRGLFSWSNGGQIFHCFPWKDPQQKEDLLFAFEDFLRKRFRYTPPVLFSINGEAEGTHLIASAIQRVTGQNTDHGQLYDFMEWKGDVGLARAGDTLAGTGAALKAASSLPPLFRIIKCDPSMTKRLTPLQVAYEKEEVVFDLLNYNVQLSVAALRKSLSKQMIFALEKDGVLVSKAGTNAAGKSVVQLGGIFTVESQRGKGYAKMVLNHLLSEIAAQKKRAVLFVKTHNERARSLYRSCGFQKIGDYEILYY